MWDKKNNPQTKDSAQDSIAPGHSGREREKKQGKLFSNPLKLKNLPLSLRGP
jgi:hypothetical protein